MFYVLSEIWAYNIEGKKKSPFLFLFPSIFSPLFFSYLFASFVSLHPLPLTFSSHFFVSFQLTASLSSSLHPRSETLRSVWSWGNTIPFCSIDVSRSSSCHTYPRLSIIAMACSVSSSLSPNSSGSVPEYLKQ